MLTPEAEEFQAIRSRDELIVDRAMTCQWCGLNFLERPHVRREQWDGKWQCKATFACAARARSKRAKEKSEQTGRNA